MRERNDTLDALFFHFSPVHIRVEGVASAMVKMVIFATALASLSSILCLDTFFYLTPCRMRKSTLRVLNVLLRIVSVRKGT